MTVPKRSQAFPERSGTAAFPAFPSVPSLREEGNVGNGKRERIDCNAATRDKGRLTKALGDPASYAELPLALIWGELQ